MGIWEGGSRGKREEGVRVEVELRCSWGLGEEEVGG